MTRSLRQSGVDEPAVRDVPIGARRTGGRVRTRANSLGTTRCASMNRGRAVSACSSCPSFARNRIASAIQPSEWVSQPVRAAETSAEASADDHHEPALAGTRSMAASSPPHLRATGRGQVADTPMIHTTAANRAEVNSISIETPTARKAAWVEGHAIRAPTRWTSDA